MGNLNWVGAGQPGDNNLFDNQFNWDPALAPNSGDDITINGFTGKTVSVANNGVVDTFAFSGTINLETSTSGLTALAQTRTVSSNSGTLALTGYLFMQGTLSNTGTIQIVDNGLQQGSQIATKGTLTLTGGGTIEFGIKGANTHLNGGTVINADNFLTGSGKISAEHFKNSDTIDLSGEITATATMANTGVIRTSGSLGFLVGGGGGTTSFSNSGTLAALAGGTLDLSNINAETPLINTGTITADGTGVVVLGHIKGGTLAATNGGVLRTFTSNGGGKAVLDGTGGALTNSTTILATGSLALTGVIINTGTIRSDNDFGTLVILPDSGGTALIGKGRVELDNSRILGATSGLNTLTNQDNTIAGFGTIGAWKQEINLVNNGTVLAEGGILSIRGAVTGTGQFHIAENATLDFAHIVGNTPTPVAPGSEIVFLSKGSEKLLISDTLNFGATLKGFGVGDQLQLALVTVSSAKWANDVLTVDVGDGKDRIFGLVGDYSKVSFAAVGGTVGIAPATLDIAPDVATRLEGQAGTTPFTFTVTRSGDTLGSHSATWTVTGATGKGTAPANAADFGGAFPTGTVTFASGETARTITVDVAGDTAIEANERFAVTLSAPSLAASIGTASAQGVIHNDDASFAVASLTPNNAEGAAGATKYVFTVTRTGATNLAHKVDWAIVGLGAPAAGNDDFVGGVLPSGTLNFPAGELVTTLNIEVAGDLAVEPTEGFAMMLSNPTGGTTISTASASAFIFNDDTQFAIAPDKADRLEGSALNQDFTFRITRAGLTDAAQEIAWTVNGAGANPAGAADFAGAKLPTGVAAFAIGETERIITLASLADSVVEADEGFVVTLGPPPAGTTVGAASAGGTIRNDDATLAIAATAADKPEGSGGGTTPFTFTVTRTGSLAPEVSAKWSAAGVAGSGTVPANATDFGGALPGGIVTLKEGVASATITVEVQPDSALELNERFAVTLATPSPGATIATATAEGIIRNDDSALAIAPLKASLAEGDGGSTPFTFSVTRSGDLSGPATAAWAVAGVAGAGTMPAAATDFAGGKLPSGTVSFAAKQASAVVTVNASGDTAKEFNERFAVTLSAPSPGASIATATAEGVILNDDENASLAISATKASQPEGSDGGATAFTFTITRSGDTSGTSTATVTVSGSGAAAADAKDFKGAVLPTGIASFAPGQTTRLVTINVAADRLVERSEGFTVTLSNPSANTVITKASATGTILNDDLAHDLGGDGRADILLQSSPDGAIRAWTHDGAGKLDTLADPIGSWGSYWQPVGLADIDGDGRSDIVLRSLDDVVLAWRMNATQVIGALPFVTLTPFDRVHVHDMNADGRAELVVGNPLNGQVTIWSRAADGTVSSASLVASPVIGTTVAGVGDFNGDGKGDVLLRNGDTTLSLLATNGATAIGTTPLSLSAVGFEVRGVGDLNGDGRSDIVLSNAADELRLWTMNGATVLANDLIRPLAPGELVTLVADFNGDRRDDLLMRNAANVLSELLMDGKTISQTVVLPNPGIGTTIA